jgi:hypothetical protein
MVIKSKEGNMSYGKFKINSKETYMAAAIRNSAQMPKLL